jgi:DNA-binding transcriptional MocR family regulator
MQVLGEAQVPVVENHFDYDLRYRGSAPPPLKAFDTRGQVLHLGTFSKMLFPGFRLGWVIVPHDLRDRLLLLKRTCDLTTNFPAQIAIAKFCRHGDLDRHLGVIRGAYADRLDAMLAAIDAHLPAVSATRPEGGMTVWLTFPPGTRSERLTTEARAAGVSIAPGTWFFVGDGRRGDRHARLSFVGESPERIESGIHILGDVLKRHLKRSRARRTAPEEAPPFM